MQQSGQLLQSKLVKEVVVNSVSGQRTRNMIHPSQKTRGGKEMKKLLVLSLAGLLILAFAGMVCAQPKFEFKASGRFDVEGITGKNNPPNNPASGTFFQQGSGGNNFNYGGPPAFAKGPAVNNGNSWLNSRGTLIFDAKMGNEVSGTVIFEIDALRWGDTPGGQIGKISERQTTGFWGGDRASVEVKNVYFDFGIPGVPVPTTLRIGEQPLAIRPTFFLYTDGPGVVAGIKADPVTISPFWFKAVEGVDWTADDVDVYGVQLRANIDKLTVGGYAVYYNMNSYPLFVNSPLLVGTVNTGLNRLVTGTNRADFWWLGAYLDGKMGPVNLNFDFVYDRGEVERRGAPVIVAGVVADDEVDYRGFAARAKIDFPWEKFNFGTILAYGSGADAKKTSTTGMPATVVAQNPTGAANNFTRKVKSYVSPPGSENQVMFGESLIFYSSPVVRYTGWSANMNNFAVNQGSLGGTWFAKLYGTCMVAPDFKVTLQGLYIGDTTKNGSTIGNAAKAINPVTGATTLFKNDNDIGFELDLITELKIYRNLTWQVGLGYMFLGDAMDFRSGTVPGTAVPINTSINNPWTLQSRVMYVF
jgi:hypothetical protein